MDFLSEALETACRGAFVCSRGVGEAWYTFARRRGWEASRALTARLSARRRGCHAVHVRFRRSSAGGAFVAQRLGAAGGLPESGPGSPQARVRRRGPAALQLARRAVLH